MSAYDRLTSNGSDLASFFRQLASPIRRYATGTTSSTSDYDWERLRAKHVGTTKRLDLFDHSLYGERGAETFLAALERSPGVETVNLVSGGGPKRRDEPPAIKRGVGGKPEVIRTLRLAKLVKATSTNIDARSTVGELMSFLMLRQSSNNLSDRGIMAITSGMKRLRARAIGACLKELNLSGNHLTDVSLHLLALHLLQPSPHPPSLTHLYLTANEFALSSSLAAFLGTCLSSSASSLRCLSLTNNPAIATSGALNLLRHLHLGSENASQLSQLHLSVCNLTPDCAEPLARWLEAPDGGASRLQVLCLNGNRLGAAGVRRIVRALTSGKASSLIHLELYANDLDEEDQTRWADALAELERNETDEDRTRFQERLERAKEMNKIVFKETRLAALGLLAKGRVLFGGPSSRSSPESPPPVSEPTHSFSRHGIDYFPFHRLPIEIQVHIFRCTLDAHPSSTAYHYSLPSSQFLDPPSSNAEHPILSTALTEAQFLSVLAHCASRHTLRTEMRIAAAQIPSLEGHFVGRHYGTAGFNDGARRVDTAVEVINKKGFTGAEEDDSEAWEEWFLRMTGCDRFQRS